MLSTWQVAKPVDHVISLRTLLAEQGVTPVDSFALGAAQSGPWAVGVEHTRVTYGAVHTAAGQIDEVGRRLSLSEKVDVVVARGVAPPGAPQATAWVTLWKRGATCCGCFQTSSNTCSTAA